MLNAMGEAYLAAWDACVRRPCAAVLAGSILFDAYVFLVYLMIERWRKDGGAGGAE